MKTLTALTVALLVVAPLALGAEPSVDPAVAATAHAQAITPFIDPLTVMIVRVDMTKIDADAVIAQIEAWQKVAIKDPKELRESVVDMKKDLQAARKVLQDFREAGGRELYAVVSVASVPMSSPLFYVVPIEPGANAEALAEITRKLDGQNKPPATQLDGSQPRPGVETAQMHGAVVVGDAMTLKRLKVLEASPQPQLQAAFGAVADAGAQMLLVASPDVRAVLAAMLPLGDDQQMERLREPVQTMIRSLRWVAAGVDLPPQTRVRLVVQAEDSRGAGDVHSALKRVFDYGLAKAAGESEDQKQLVLQAGQILMPEPKGSQLVRTIGSDQIDKFLAQVRPPLALARSRARRSFSMNNIGQFGRAMHIYQAEKKTWPDSIRQMIEVAMRMPYDESMDLLANPQRPNMKPAYVYRKPGLPIDKIASPGETIFLYERFDDWGDGVNVGFLDGHVTFVSDQAEFEKMLARTQSLDPGGSVAAAPTTQKASTK